MVFQNINVNKNTLTFEINNEDSSIKVGLANAIRRIALSDISIFAIHRESVEFDINSSMLNNDIISQRLPFIPLLYHGFDNMDLAKLTVSLEKANKQGTSMIDIMSGDLQFVVDGQPIDNGLFLLSKNVLIGKLKPNQEMKLKAKVIKQISKQNSSAHSPVSIATMTYKRNDEILKEFKAKLSPEQYADFEVGDSYKHYIKNGANEPAIYLFEIETIGTLTTSEIVSMALQILLDKLNDLITNFDKRIVIKTSDMVLDSFDFTMENEDDTIGNLLQQYLMIMEEVRFAGYRIVHPNDNIMYIRTALKNNNTLEKNREVFIKNMNNVAELAKKLKDEWDNPTPIASTTKKIKIVKKV